MTDQQLTLESLRHAGAEARDPVRYRYLQALAARIPAQPRTVQVVLSERLRQGMAACEGHLRASAAQDPRAGAMPRARSALAQLNDELAARTAAQVQQARMDGAPAAPSLQSARAFGEVWSRIASQQQVAQALGRGPRNAGPLNPHRLMVRSLALMQELSPDYLRRFLAQAQALAALDEALQGPPRAPLRRGRPRQSAR